MVKVIRHISEQKDVYLRMRKYIELIKQYGFDYQAVLSFLGEFVPKGVKGNNLINYDVSSFNGDRFLYNPTQRRIDIALCSLRAHVVSNVDALAESFGVTDKDKFCSYLALFSVAAEIEKAYEHLMSDGIIIAPSSSIRNGYRELFRLFEDYEEPGLGLIKKAKKARSAVLYDKERFIHAIDRNANLESARLMRDVAKDNGDIEISHTFEGMNGFFESIGYHRDGRGCFDHTFRDIGMKNATSVLNTGEQLDTDTCIEYGLEVPEEVRQMVLKKDTR